MVLHGVFAIMSVFGCSVVIFASISNRSLIVLKMAWIWALAVSPDRPGKDSMSLLSSSACPWSLRINDMTRRGIRPALVASLGGLACLIPKDRKCLRTSAGSRLVVVVVVADL